MQRKERSGQKNSNLSPGASQNLLITLTRSLVQGFLTFVCLDAYRLPLKIIFLSAQSKMRRITKEPNCSERYNQQIITALFAEPRGDKARAERLEESSGSRRDYRHVYSLLAGTAAIAADIT